MTARPTDMARKPAMKKMNKSLKSTLILCVLGLAVVFQGCGRKAPPIPPGAVVPPRVSALSHTITDNTVTLTWTAPEGKGAKSVDGYDVMRSMTSQDEEECKSCPIVFARLVRLGPSQTSYTDTLVAGKRYIYKVVAVTSYQVQGKDSKLIRFSYPEEKKKDTDDDETVEPEAGDESPDEAETDQGGDANGGEGDGETASPEAEE